MSDIIFEERRAKEQTQIRTEIGRRKMKKGTLHAIAHCRDCDWKEEDYETALRKGREHSRKTGHIVDAETGYWYVYGEKQNSGMVKK